MNRNHFQDVVPPNRRSIRDIPISDNRRGRKRIERGEPAEVVSKHISEDLNKNYSYPNFQNSRRKFFSAKTLATFAVIVIGGFVFVMMTAFTSARVEIIPKQKSISLTLSVEASKNPSPGTDSLRFEVFELKKESQIEVEANGEEMAEKKASGFITVYNNFSSEPQRLIARTRFETSEGLIYRITDSITVPGKTLNGPGSVETRVHADEAGDKYNIGKTDFTIPGFKSDSVRYKEIYAKSKTEMSGGFIGKVKKISEQDREQALKNLKGSITEYLDKEKGSIIPDNLIALDGSTSYEFRDLGQGEPLGRMAVLKSEGTARVMAFDKNALAAIIANTLIPEWQGLPVEIRSFEGIKVSFDLNSDYSANIVPLRLFGTTSVFAAINGADIASSLKGMPKSDLDTIMAQFEGVMSAKATVRPLWKTGFPADEAKIHIDIK